MNPLTNVKNLNKLNQHELELGLTTKKSWHDKYKDSAWIFIGGLPYDLTEGDVLCIFSQYGEIVNVNLVRDQKTGKSKGFCFLCYEDQRSTILSVDNFNGAKVLGRTLRVDHVEEYRKPKDHGDEDELTKKLRAEGCAPRIESSPAPEEDLLPIKPKKEKRAKKEKKKKKKKKKGSSSSDNSSDSEEDDRSKNKVKTEPNLVKVKREKHDSGYDKALEGGMSHHKRSYNETDNQRDWKYARVGDHGGVGHGDMNTDRYTGRGRNGGSAMNSERDRSRVRDGSRERERFGDRGQFRDSDRFQDRERSRDKEVFGDRQRSRDNYRDMSRDKEQSKDRERLRDRERGGDRSGGRERYFDRDDRTSFHRQKELGRNRDLQAHRDADRDIEANRNKKEGRHYGDSSRESWHEDHRDRENRHSSRDQRERDEEYRRNTSDKRSDRYRDRH